jgi:23S rRNA pseudouridine1911/1915/1917 synthase
MKYYSNYNREGDYEHYEVKSPQGLLDFLLENVGQSRSKVKATLQGQGIKVNGKTVTQFDFPLQPGMKVAVSQSKRNQKGFKNRFVKIVYEDRWLIVVEKNIGILSMAAGHSTLNVKSVLDDYFKKSHQKCTAHVVHRLDRDTSGLMVYAKDIETEQILEHNWHQIVYDRRYVAVVSGEMELDEGTISNWLKDNKAYITYSSPVDNGGKLAITHFHVLDRTTEHSLVEFKLETGRKNQIRVHSADMGHPVCGDMKYGNGDDPLHRLCLHAWLLCFSHPITGQPMEFETPIPTPFRMLFKH